MKRGPPTAGQAPSGGPSKAGQAPSGGRLEAILAEHYDELFVPPTHDWGLIRRLMGFVHPYRKRLSVALVAIALTALLGLGRPLVMRFVLDFGVIPQDLEALTRGGMLLFVLIVCEQVLVFLQIYLTQVVGVHALGRVRHQLFVFLHSLRLSYFEKQPVGRLVTRLTNDVDAIQELFASGALAAFGDLLRLTGIVILMLALDVRLALVALAAVPPVALLVRLMRRRMRDAYRQIRTKTARLNAELGEQLAGLAVIQAYGREEAALEQFDRTNRDYCQANIRAVRYDAIQDAALESAAAVCVVAVVVSAGYAPTSFGTMVALVAYLFQFFEPISALAQRYTLLQNALAGLERVSTLLDTHGEEDAPKHAAVRGAVLSQTALELRQVEFSYRPGLPVLRGTSLEVASGEVVALVGLTGSGKSTIAALFERLYEPSRGMVLVEGRDVRSWNSATLRRHFAMVPQDPMLLPGTVAANVAAGGTPDPDRVREALEQVGLLATVEARPGGIEAQVGEYGNRFSQGERQLIACARALYRNARVLIMDEATASVDSATEAKLGRALAVLLQGRTALIIAHRASTVRRANRVLVLHHGLILEQGAHDVLMRRRGLYRELYELQLARDDANR
ncbi:ABC transporter ATP-binding protein [Myxococcota bacterium]